MKVLWPAQGGIMQGPEAPSASFICMAVALSVVSAIVGLLVRLLSPDASRSQAAL